jgi:hypothetical protein
MLRRIVQVRSHEYLLAGWQSKSFHAAGSGLAQSAQVAGMNFVESMPPVPSVNKADVFAFGVSAMTRGAQPRRPAAQIFNVVANFDDEEAVARLKFDRRAEVIEVYADLEIAAVAPAPYTKAAAVGSDQDVARLLRVPELAAAGMTGRNVRVVIVDTGIDGSLVNVEALGWAPDGLTYVAGSANATDPILGHGTMCAHDARIAAPQAKFHDFALLRQSAGGMTRFLSDVLAAYGRLADLVEDDWTGQAVVVNNSWAVFDRSADLPVGTPGNYGANLNHPVNQQIGALASLGVDIVFAAGNCGMPGPDGRCSINDRGPGKSVHGANSHPDVVSVAAVTTDDRRLAYSSQGPGTISSRKPDLCSYTHFSTGSAWPLHSGTSAAAPVLSGLIAALRTRVGGHAISPAALRSILQSTARNPLGSGWNGEFGHGIVDVRAILQQFGIASPGGPAGPAAAAPAAKAHAKLKVAKRKAAKRKAAGPRKRARRAARRAK